MRTIARWAGPMTIIALALAACGHPATPPPGGGTPATSSPPATSSTAASAPGTTSSAPSALGQLAVFLSAAVWADSKLHHAAALVNADIGPTSMRFTPATLAGSQPAISIPITTQGRSAAAASRPTTAPHKAGRSTSTPAETSCWVGAAHERVLNVTALT